MQKNIPKVDKVLEWPVIKALLAQYQRPLLVKAVRAVLADLRFEALAGRAAPEAFSEEVLSERVRNKLTATEAYSLQRVVNGTGVIIHTNLGRSPLPEPVRQHLTDIAFGYSNLEFDLGKGSRGSRHTHVEQLLRDLTGAETALVVNNNAAAVLLALSALAEGREVIVSRGELVEIGGSFRIPDVMRLSGATLTEVGTTNRTHQVDYRKAVSPATALLLKVHQSNFAQSGFTAEVTAADLARIGAEYALPVMADLGSGCLLDLSPHLHCCEPTVQDYLREGVAVVTFSGDKLLGGPQAGIIVGRKSCLDPMRSHPLLRAMRIDKMTLAALEGTLRLYRDEREALAQIPALRMLTRTEAELRLMGRTLLRRLRRLLPGTVRLSLECGSSRAGGGALPLLELPTSLITIEIEGVSPHQLEVSLRTGAIPVIGRISRNRFLLDLRTILDADIPLLIQALRSLGE
jgi:L-seryl-tRNA(Ser) seleniumtransferase